MLNFEFYGRDFKNKINAWIACSILFPPIDPDLSRMNIYSPLYSSKLDLTEEGG